MSTKFNDQLRITEIFHSLQGESLTVGKPTVFVRLTGCPLRCQYCDTSYAFQGGETKQLSAILDTIKSYHCKHVCVTGGEPLAQKGANSLMTQLCDGGFHVSIETSGALPIKDIDSRVMIVMDVKTPDSGESHRQLWHNFDDLKSSDQIKFVLCSREDYLWSMGIIEKYDLYETAHVLFSPSWGQLNPTDLANWIVSDGLDVRFQLQLHKILWHDAPGH